MKNDVVNKIIAVLKIKNGLMNKLTNKLAKSALKLRKDNNINSRSG